MTKTIENSNKATSDKPKIAFLTSLKTKRSIALMLILTLYKLVNEERDNPHRTYDDVEEDEEDGFQPERHRRIGSLASDSFPLA